MFENLYHIALKYYVIKLQMASHNNINNIAITLFSLTTVCIIHLLAPYLDV